jgi:hypothetical protein
MLIKRLRGGRKRRQPSQEEATSGENENNAMPRQPPPPIFHDQHFDLLVPAPIPPPPLPLPLPSSVLVNEDASMQQEEFMEEDDDDNVNDFTRTMDEDRDHDHEEQEQLHQEQEEVYDSIIRFVEDLQRPSPPPYNPNFLQRPPPPNPNTTAAAAAAAAVPVISNSKGLFPPTQQDDTNIPFVTAIRMEDTTEEEIVFDAYEVSDPRSSRANMFAPSHDNSDGSYYGTDPVQPQCFVVNPSCIEHVIIDGPTTTDRSSSPSPLPPQIQRMLYKSRKVCHKAIRIAKQQLNKPCVKNAIQRSTSLVQDTSRRLIEDRHEIAQSVGRTVKRTTIQAYRSVREYDNKHHVSRRIVESTQNGVKHGTRSVKNQLIKFNTTMTQQGTMMQRNGR